MASMLDRLSLLARETHARLPRLLDTWLPGALRETAILVSIALAAVSLVLFAQLADEVIEGETHAFDEAVLLALRHAGDPSDPIGPGWFEDAMRDVTALGSLGVLTFLTAAVAGFLILQGKRHAALLVVVAIGEFRRQELQGHRAAQPDVVGIKLQDFPYPQSSAIALGSILHLEPQPTLL